MPRETDGIYGMTAGHGVTIEVDEAIFGVLTYEQRPGETYNDVVRRLLGMPPKDGAADEHGTGPLPGPRSRPRRRGSPPARMRETGTMSEKKTVTVAGETGDPGRRPGQRCLGLFGLHPGSPGATQTLLLCDGCYQSGTGLLAECEDGCPHDLDHTGLCLRDSPIFDQPVAPERHQDRLGEAGGGLASAAG
ncbi:MAG TPA: hypothetical protein VII22_07260 [Streptosporangiaceae bacterium]